MPNGPSKLDATEGAFHIKLAEILFTITKDQ
jgi:hypothetical protein